MPSVYEELETEFVVESREVEVTSAFGGVSALLLLAGGALSLLWFRADAVGGGHSMGLLWPAYLLLLTAIPLVVLAYVLALRREEAVCCPLLQPVPHTAGDAKRLPVETPSAVRPDGAGHRVAHPGPLEAIRKRDGGFQQDHRNAGAGRIAEHVRR